MGESKKADQIRRQTSRRKSMLLRMNQTFSAAELHPRDRADEVRLRDAGFRWGQKGTHTSRTIMLESFGPYWPFAGPMKTRRLPFCNPRRQLPGKADRRDAKDFSQRLSELYALDPKVPAVPSHATMLVRRPRWASSPRVAAGPRTRPATKSRAPPVLRMRPGEELARQQMTDALNRAVGNRLSESTLDKVVRNAASSWTQSGHLKGRGRKVRQSVTPTARSTAYALLLGYFTGTRGAALFESLWAQVLDAQPANWRTSPWTPGGWVSWT